jgi:hypothetical protein
MSKRFAVMVICGVCLLTRAAAAQIPAPLGPPSAPMTIPLPEPLFWDPINSTGDYAVVEQKAGLYLLRPGTGRVIAKLVTRSLDASQPLGANRSEQRPPGPEVLPSPPGWPFQTSDAIPATPLVDDLDRDGSADLVCVTREGWVWVVGADALPPAGWPVRLGVGCQAAPGLADLDGDGLPEILVADLQGSVHALRRDGTYVRGWPARIPGRAGMPAIYGAVVAADLDRDGTIEVIVTQASGRVCVFRADGRVVPGWPVATTPAVDPPNAGAIFGRPAVGDIDGDGRLEVIAAANNYGVYAWKANGGIARGWPRLLDNRGRAGYGDPVLVDIAGDAKPEILVTTDQGFSGPPRVYAFDGAGRPVKGWPAILPERCNAGVAAGDLDGDGSTEIVAATVGADAWICVWGADGRPRRGFPVGLAGMSANSAPILADVSGDELPDIIVAATRAHFDPAAALIAFDRHGNLIEPFPVRIEGAEIVCGGPCAHDMNGDGRLELVLGTEVQGKLYAWETMGSAIATASPWPRAGFDAANSGCYASPNSRPAPAPPHIAGSPAQPAIEPPPAAFSPLQSVSFILGSEGHVRLCVSNVQGVAVRTLLDSSLPTGAYAIAWNGLDDYGHAAPPGVYFYDLTTPERQAHGQLLLLR